jgi:UDP-N-acetylmuramate dehydrogenase
MRVRISGVKELASDAGANAERVLLQVGAGEELDPFVERCVRAGHAGVECLSGIPGFVGATPIQNVGAYGQEIGETVVTVRAMERASGTTNVFDKVACRFSYRSSIFKEVLQDRYIVLTVTLALSRQGTPALRYPELVRELASRGRDPGSLSDVRDVVLSIRRSKSMVIDKTDPNHQSAGSFFVNPVVAEDEANRIEEVARALGSTSMPRFAVAGDKVKLSAAWLIERSGFSKGSSDGPVGISTRHALAIVNRGGATAAQILGFASRVRQAVHARFGIALTPEPVLVGFSEEEARALRG